jgi:hypothetical protein
LPGNGLRGARSGIAWRRGPLIGRRLLGRLLPTILLPPLLPTLLPSLFMLLLTLGVPDLLLTDQAGCQQLVAE